MSISNSKGNNLGKKVGGNGLVAVAIDKDKNSQHALRWAVDNLLGKGQTVVLIHVVSKSTGSVGNAATCLDPQEAISAHREQLEKQTRELYLTFHCYCTRKEIQCFDVLLEDSCIARAIAEYTTHAAINHLVLGSSRHGFIWRLKTVDVPTAVLKAAPDFCTIYVISKTKLSSVRNASRQAPFASPLYDQIYQSQHQVNENSQSQLQDAHLKHTYSIKGAERTPRKYNDWDLARSPFAKGSPSLFGKQHGELSESESDISFISSNRPSGDRMSSMLYDSIESNRTSRLSTSSDSSLNSERLGYKGSEISSHDQFSSSSLESDDVEAEMRRLKIELLKTMDLYSSACKEAIMAKQKATELQRWRMEEGRRIREAQQAEEEALEIAENEKVKYGMAVDDVDAARRIAELESKRQFSAEKQALQEKKEKHNMLDHYDIRYRRYTIKEIEEATEFFAETQKIGEGGYGPVFKCSLDHTTVAVKVLRPDATQGRSQFHQEVEVLSCMRHPNIVLLLGVCPEYGCLVYEYLANGSLEDCLFRRGNSPTLSWQLRFRIIAEIATGLLFLHRTKPEPIVHRDLKPGNILLDHNFVSKISDVGLARLVPPISDDVTQYRMTSAAGTFCYIDPEYQQTGMLGVKSDIYSLGIIILQTITAKPAMGLTHHVARAIENVTFKEILDPHVPDWPIEETLSLAKLSLQCAELRRKDRPDLGKVILPELNKLRALAEENFSHYCVH